MNRKEKLSLIRLVPKFEKTWTDAQKIEWFEVFGLVARAVLSHSKGAIETPFTTA